MIFVNRLAGEGMGPIGMEAAPRLELVICAVRALSCLAYLDAVTNAAAQSEAEPPIRIGAWISLQRNANGSTQWKAEPRLYPPIGRLGGWAFKQRIDVPFVYTDKTRTANPGEAWSFGLGNMFAEEIALSPKVAAGLRLRGSVRFVFPTGKAAPFGYRANIISGHRAPAPCSVGRTTGVGLRSSPSFATSPDLRQPNRT